MKGPRILCRLFQQQLGLISAKLLSLSGEMLSEFSRQPHGLDMLDRWKATELRQFVLYTGPLVLKDIIGRQYYKHFISLHIPLSILLDDDDDKRNAYLDYAKQLLSYFVAESAILYGDTFNKYNVHGMLHIADDSTKYGCSLNAISAFPFENHLQIVKKYVRNPQNAIAQCAKRIAERASSGL
jgi:hypothetical protein